MSLHNKRRGSAAIFALTLLPLLGFGALSVDVGLQRMTVTQIQAAAEAGSTGGAAYLNGTTDGLTAAVNRAKLIAELNYVYGDALNIDVNSDVELWVYDENDGSHVVADVNWANPGEVNAVHVVPDTTLDPVLSRFVFGVEQLAAAGDATAVVKRGGVAKYVDCYLPFALPSCVFDGWRNLDAGGNPAPRYLLNDASDTLSWGLPDVPRDDGSNNNPTPGNVQAQLGDACSGGTAGTADTGDGVCTTNDCATAGDDSEEMALNNGVGATTLRYIADLINEDTYSPNVGPWPTGFTDLPTPDRNDFTFNPWPEAIKPAYTLVNRQPAHWGYSIQGVVPIIEHDCTTDAVTGEVVTSTALNQSEPIVGWTYAYLYDVSDNAPASDGTGMEKPFLIQFDFVNEYDIGYGQCEGDNCDGNVSGTEPPTQVW